MDPEVVFNDNPAAAENVPPVNEPAPKVTATLPGTLVQNGLPVYDIEAVGEPKIWIAVEVVNVAHPADGGNTYNIRY